MKKRIIIGNWKTNKTQKEVKEFFKILNASLKNKNICCTFGVAPVAIHLELAKSLAPKQMIIAAQDANYISSGAFTGTISWSQLKDIKIKYVIVGHSERRMYYNETDDIVNKKVKNLLENKMIPILCIGENIEEFNNKKTYQVCATQLKKALLNVPIELLSNLIVAYEPIWAIGTGKTATVDIAQNTIKKIRQEIEKIANSNIAKKVKILYGGSVKPDNIESLMKQPDIDGALVGGASLLAKDYLKLLGK
ncbi:triose-phosphate isomerase [Mycoplasmoides pirum]|uniref:triose-phosphate isomerase n=1 Tax=Mycoplasmoides pirum TaxID=2122 RepID=UPI000488F374|nr:triose-phosphate isomerase [Mycoplasmoides pirum]